MSKQVRDQIPFPKQTPLLLCNGFLPSSLAVQTVNYRKCSLVWRDGGKQMVYICIKATYGDYAIEERRGSELL